MRYTNAKKIFCKNQKNIFQNYCRCSENIINCPNANFVRIILKHTRGRFSQIKVIGAIQNKTYET